MTKGGKQIPIQKEPKTLQQETADQHEKLAKSQEVAKNEAGDQPMSHWKEPWSNEISQWMENNTNSMQDTMNRMRNSMMSLMPMDQFDLDRWHHHGMPLMSHFPDFGSNMFEKMERDMEAQRQKILAEANLNQLVPKPETVGEMMNIWKNAYEIGEDGHLHFKVRLDVNGYKPEHIKVGTVNNRLVIHAKEDVTSEDDKTTTHKEFSRSITLPKSVEGDKITCKLTEDGILCLEAPVNEPNYHAITFDKEQKIAIKANEETPLPLTGTVGITNMEAEGSRKLHFEMPVESVYHSQDIRVRTDSNKVLVSGHKVIDGVTHEFTQSIDSSETIDPAHVRAQLNKHTLVVEAPYVNIHHS